MPTRLCLDQLLSAHDPGGLAASQGARERTGICVPGKSGLWGLAFHSLQGEIFFFPYGNWNYTNRNSRSPSHLWILFHSCVQEQPGINLLKFYKTHRCNDPILPIKLTVEYPSGNKKEGCLNSGRAVGAEGVCAWHVHCLSTFSQPLNREKFPGLIIIVIFPQPLN